MAEKTTIVDIIPVVTPTGDYMKIRDTNPANINNKVNTLLNLLQMVSGSSMFYPEMGDYETLSRIPFNSVELIISELKERIQKFIDFSVDIDYEETGVNRDHILLKATISGLPGIISFGVTENNGFVELLNPKYVESK